MADRRGSLLHLRAGVRLSPDARAVGTIDPQGLRKPICRDCVHALNELRDEMGIAPVRVPPGAYERVEL